MPKVRDFGSVVEAIRLHQNNGSWAMGEAFREAFLFSGGSRVSEYGNKFAVTYGESTLETEW